MSLTEYLNQSLHHIVRIHDEGTLSAEETVEVMTELIRENNYWVRPWEQVPEVVKYYDGLHCFLSEFDPPSREEMIGDILVKQEKCLAENRRLRREVPDREADFYVTHLVLFCVKWNRISDSAIEKLQLGYFERHPVRLTVEEASQIAGFGEMISRYENEISELIQNRFITLKAAMYSYPECLEGYEDELECACFDPDFWVEFAEREGCSNYYGTNMNEVLSKARDDKILEFALHEADMEKMPYLQLMEVWMGQSKMSQFNRSEWRELWYQTAAEFLILMTTLMYEIGFDTKVRKCLSRRVNEESTHILLNEEAVDELYEGLKSIYDCMTHFNTRTSGRWKGLFPMNSKQISSKP